ncbi:Uncharacterised protein [BD1-7 clade bacterium]|uniref:Transglutaminase-like domain-containing protein n=1 Tax=BD1-7 clade bacterium TaxID=2029982 RepID=A0A5S9Q4J6_9GAMM|nr:Uncharacterised protein [BD1-7 clade bacterium]
MLSCQTMLSQSSVLFAVTRNRIISFIALFMLIAMPASANSIAPSLAEQQAIPRTNSGAEILYSISETNVRADYNWTSTQYRSIRLNDTNSSRDYGRISVPYDGYYTKVTLEFARVLTADGDIKELSADAVITERASRKDFYDDSRRLIFALPALTPGAMIEYQVKFESKKLSLPNHFAGSFSGYFYQPKAQSRSGRIDTVHNSRLSLTYAPDAKLNFAYEGPHKPTLKKSRTASGAMHYNWQWPALPEVILESNRGPARDYYSSVDYSTSQDWSIVDQWAWGMFESKFEPQPALTTLAQSLASPSDIKIDKVKAVYGYLQENIRYVFAHLDRGGYEPHAANRVIQAGYGDCKDQTVLALSLLHALGIEAYPALVVTPWNGQPNMSMVELVFDHMIVWIPKQPGHQEAWMDTTGDRNLFPGTSGYLDGQPALIVNGEGGILKVVNEENLAHGAQMDIFWRTENNNLMADLTLTFSGEIEDDYRHWWRSEAKKLSAESDTFAQLFNLPRNKYTIKTQTLNANDLWEPFTMKATMDFGPAREEGEESLFISVNAVNVLHMFGLLNGLPVPADRLTDWYDMREYHIDTQVTFSPELGRYAGIIGQSSMVETPYYVLEQIHQTSTDGPIIDLKYTKKPFIVKQADYTDYYNSKQDLKLLNGWEAVFADESTGKPVKDDAETSLSIAQKRVGLVYTELNNGRFDDALVFAEQAVEADKAHGEAWYVLGLAHGYNFTFDKAQEAFKQARALGYQPTEVQ